MNAIYISILGQHILYVDTNTSYVTSGQTPRVEVLDSTEIVAAFALTESLGVGIVQRGAREDTPHPSQ